MITGDGSIMKFINGGQSSNVYWAVGTSCTSGTNAHFIGNILAQTSITLGGTSSLNGRAFALNTVTYSGKCVHIHFLCSLLMPYWTSLCFT
jgi:hypothetical protein